MIYTNRDAVKFVKDMENAGLEVEHYHGRFFWEGPAVRVETRHDALGKTTVHCQWDNMGRGFIVYPISSDAGTPK